MFQLPAMSMPCGVATVLYFIFPLQKNPKLLISGICAELDDLVLICDLLEPDCCWKPESRTASSATCFGFICLFFEDSSCIYNFW